MRQRQCAREMKMSHHLSLCHFIPSSLLSFHSCPIFLLIFSFPLYLLLLFFSHRHALLSFVSYIFNMHSSVSRSVVIKQQIISSSSSLFSSIFFSPLMHYLPSVPPFLSFFFVSISTSLYAAFSFSISPSCSFLPVIALRCLLPSSVFSFPH